MPTPLETIIQGLTSQIQNRRGAEAGRAAAPQDPTGVVPNLFRVQPPADPAQRPQPVTPQPSTPQAAPEPTQAPQGPSPEVQAQASQILQALLAGAGTGGGSPFAANLGSALGLNLPVKNTNFQPGSGAEQIFQTDVLDPLTQALSPELTNNPLLAALFDPSSFIGTGLGNQPRGQVGGPGFGGVQPDIQTQAILGLLALLGLGGAQQQTAQPVQPGNTGGQSQGGGRENG